jgi:hypothetical protein
MRNSECGVRNKELFVKPTSLRILQSALVILLFAGCRQDDQIQTYHVAKEAAPALPPGRSGDPAAPSHKEIEWKLPAGWQEQPPSSMRLGSFRVAGGSGGTADVSVIALSGMAGGDLANINRWRGQIELDPISEQDLAKNSRTISPAGRPMVLVDFVNAKKRLIAAIYVRGDRTWFFKMIGDDHTVKDAKPAFLDFLDSLKFNDL